MPSTVYLTCRRLIKMIISHSLPGPNGIGKGVLEKCNSCVELFTVLKQRGYISRDNVLYLNKILYVLQQHDLLQKTVEYCKKEGDVIHYYSVDRRPDVGEKEIKIHVKADVQNYNKEQLDRLRNVVASIACIPPEEILISAVEPGSSFIIIFTMPEMYADILQSLLEKKVNLWRFTAIDVDIIIIDGKQYDVTGQDAVINVNEQCKELMNVYKQLEKTRSDLEEMEINNLDCQKELEDVSDRLKKAESTMNSVESLEKRNSELATLCSMLQSMHFTYGVTESSIESLQHLMAEASNKGQDKELIQRIIRANTEIVAACHRNRNEIEHQEKSIKMEKRKCIEFELRRDLVSGTKTAEEVLHEYYSQFLKDIDNMLKNNLDATKSLQKTSNVLSSEQKTTLVNMFQWPNNDVIKACIDADEDLLLLGVACKEAMMENKQINTNDLLARCGKAIELDLISIFHNANEQLKKERSEQDNLKFNKKLIQLLEEHTKTAQEIITMFSEKVLCKVLDSDINDSVLRSVIQKCKGLYFFLNENESKELLNMKDWPKDDVVRRCIREDTDLLIFGLFIKHIEQVSQWIPPETFLAEIQIKLKRSDLLNLYRLIQSTKDKQQMQFKNVEEKRLEESKLFQDLQSKRKSAEYVLKRKLTNLTVKLGEDINYANEPAFLNLTKLLREISAQFKDTESNRLLQQCKWDDGDVIRECIQVDKTLLIQGLWQKEIENMQAFTEPDKFLLDVCKEVDRLDIYHLFKQNEMFVYFDAKIMHNFVDVGLGIFRQINQYTGKHWKETTDEKAAATDASAKSDPSKPSKTTSFGTSS